MDVKLFCRLVCFLVAVFPTFVNSNLITDNGKIYWNDKWLVSPTESDEFQDDRRGDLKGYKFIRKLNEEEKKRAVLVRQNFEKAMNKQFMDNNEDVSKQDISYHNNDEPIDDEQMDTMDKNIIYTDHNGQIVGKNYDNNVNGNVYHVITGNGVYGHNSGKKVNSFNSFNSPSDMDQNVPIRDQVNSIVRRNIDRNLSKSHRNMQDNTDDYNRGSNPIIGDNKQNVVNKDNSFNVNNNNNGVGKVIKQVFDGVSSGLSKLPSMKFFNKFGPGLL